MQGNSDPFGLSVIILTGISGRRNCSEKELEHIKKFKHKKNDTRKTKTTSLTNLTKTSDYNCTAKAKGKEKESRTPLQLWRPVSLQF